MRSSNSTVYQNHQNHQNHQSPRFIDDAVSSCPQQHADIENQRAAQNATPVAQLVHLVVARQTALIYVRDRPVVVPAPIAVALRPAAAPAQAAVTTNGPVLSQQTKAAGVVLGACIVVGASAAALRNMYS